MLLDNITSHLSIEVTDLAIENEIKMVSFPPHCSHRLQPLDVSVFGPLKTFYNTKCDEWLMANASILIEIQHIPKLVKGGRDSALTPRNIKSEFQATGIYPQNRNMFSNEDFQLAAIADENVSATAEPVDQDDQRNIVFFNEDIGAKC